MLCPKCNSSVNGDWCIYCGANLKELNSKRRVPVNHTYSKDSSAPTKSDTQVLRSEEFNDDFASSGGDFYSPENGLNPYGKQHSPTEAKDNKAKIIAIICVCAAAFVIIVALLVYKFVFSNNPAKPKDTPTKKPVISETDSKIKKLTLEAEEYMDNGDYEGAEEAYLELKNISDDDEVDLIYEILYNFNRATNEYKNENYKNAEKFYDRIPTEYEGYDISSDIDDLYDDILSAQKAENKLDMIADYINSEDYDAAREAIDTIDGRHLSESGKERLAELYKELKTLEEKRDNEQRSYDYPDSGKGYLEFDDAQSIIYNYCTHMTSAINAGDYSIVAPYILSSSDFSQDQSKLITMCVSQGITESLDSVKLNSLTKISDTKWVAEVIEKETIFYSDKSSESKTFNWKYTIEYHDRRFYITDLK